MNLTPQVRNAFGQPLQKKFPDSNFSARQTETKSSLSPYSVPGLPYSVHLIYGVIKSGQPFDAHFPSARLAFQDGI